MQTGAIQGGLNVVGEVLRGQADFVEMEHFPRMTSSIRTATPSTTTMPTAVRWSMVIFILSSALKACRPGLPDRMAAGKRSLAEGR